MHPGRRESPVGAGARARAAYVILAVSLLLTTVSLAQLPFPAESAELDGMIRNIGGLSVPQDEQQLQEELQRAETSIDKYRAAINNPPLPLPAAELVPARKAEALAAIDGLLGLPVKNCGDPRTLSLIQVFILRFLPNILMREAIDFSPQEGVVHIGYIQQLKTLAETPDQLCKKLAAGEFPRQAVRDQVNRYFEVLERTLRFTHDRRELEKASAPKLLSAWERRRDSLRSAMAPFLQKHRRADQLADNMWKLGLVIAVFSLAVMFLVRKFNEPAQMEWIASGQVTQFMTVIALLIVIMLLGLSGVLSENTLGTLLGGLAGYVLSQGIGRGATRTALQSIAAERARPAESGAGRSGGAPPLTDGEKAPERQLTNP